MKYPPAYHIYNYLLNDVNHTQKYGEKIDFIPRKRSGGVLLRGKFYENRHFYIHVQVSGVSMNNGEIKSEINKIDLTSWG